MMTSYFADEVLGKRSAFDKEYRILRQTDGAECWVHGMGRLEFDAQGKPLRMRGMIKDITEHRRAELALAATELRFRTFFEENGSVMFLADPDTGEIMAANRAACEFYGYSKGQLIGMSTHQITINPPEDCLRDRQMALREERSCFYYSQRLASGEVREIELHSSPFEVDGRRLLCAIVNDITERKRAEKALIESEKLFRAITETSPLAMVLVSGTERSEYMNPTFIRLFGYTREDIPTVAEWWPLAYPDAEYRQKVMESWTSAIAYTQQIGNPIDPLEFVVACKDGSRRTIEWGLVNIGDRSLAYGVDITERKQAEIQRRNSEEHYRSTFEQAAVGILHASFDGIILRSNARFAEMVGYTAEELPGIDVLQITLPEDCPASREMLERVLSGGIPASLEKRYLRKDGSTTWVKLTLSIQRDGEGRALYFTGLVEDINARKAAEERLAAAGEALRLSEERFRATFEQAAVGIIHTSLSGRILRSNERFAEIIGYPLEEIPQLTFQQITPPDDLQESVDVLQQMLGGATRNASWEKRYVRKDGSLTWARLTVSTLRDDQGRALHFIAVIEDINARKRAEENLSAATEALRVSEERYRVAFQTSLDSITINRLADGTYVEVNDSFLRSTLHTRQEVIGRTSLDLNIWANPSDRQKLVEILSRDSTCLNLEFPMRKKNGELLWGMMSASVIELEGVPCILAITRDISDAKAAEQSLAAATSALRASEERYRTVFHTSLDCITISHLSDGRYIDVNKAFLDLIEIEPHEIVGRTSVELGIWAHPETRSEIVELLRRNSSIRDFQTQFVKKSGELIWVLISASVIEIGGVSCIVSVVRDISSAKAAEHKIHNLAFYDPLTGLCNRRMLMERLRQTLASSARRSGLQALLLLDLDNLKTLNDTLGHQVGDLLLQEVARRIADCAHEADTVGRLGGDEFVVILEDLSEVAEEAGAQAKAAAERILAAVSQPYLLDDRECLSASSMGITVFGDRQNTADEILQQADIALHMAKTAGRNTLRFFSPALQAAVNARATMEDGLRQAIKRKQFLLYYQPQIERGRMTGAEALIRWNHPGRGLVSPDEFIPLAEESRLILPLGDWVLETACKQIAAWAGHVETDHLTISVNISALQFRQPEFVKHVLEAIDRTGAKPKNLKLELTESMLVENVEEIIAKMTELKLYGLSFSLDDFGTGYSSLAYLKRLPLDQLKIDRAFVRDILVDVTSGAIAQTILSLGRAMDLSVVAEGVETEEQRGFLAGLGCHSFQGDLFSPPLPLEGLQAFF